MLQNERIDDLEDSLRAVLAGFQANIWTAMPGIVQSYNAVKGTVVVQVAIKANILNLETGATTTAPLDPQVDVPVCYMGGGGFVATFPIQQGDTALVVFASRCIDAWWQSGKVSAQAESRMHSLSDGFAIVGPRSLANAIPNVSTSTVQLRSLDGSTYYEIAAGQVANIVAPGRVNVQSPAISMGASGSTPQALMTHDFYTYWTTHIYPFLVGLGYTGPVPPVDSITTNVEGA